MKKIIYLFVLFFLIISCSDEVKVGDITINGKVLTDDVKEIKFTMTENIAIKEIEYIAEVNTDSTFTITIPSEYPLLGTIHSGGFYHKIFFSPGDELFIEIEGDTISYKGHGSNPNTFLYEILEKENVDGYYQLFREKGGLNEIADMVQERRKNFISIVKENETKYQLDKKFIDRILLINETSYIGFMLNYPRSYAYRNKMKLDSVNLPKEFSDLKLVSNFIDDKKLSTREYFYLIRTFVYEKVREFNKTKPNKKDSAIQIVLFDSLYGKTKDYGIANWLDTEFNFNRYDTVIYDRFKNEITNSDAQNIVQESFEKYNSKQMLINSPLIEEFNLTLLEDDKGNELTFGDMVNKYVGNVIYLDFWSLGCGPCRTSMPKSKELKEKLKDYPIDFVYITTDRKNENLWKEVYKVTLTEENHFRFSKGFNAKLLKFMKINWVPNYMLIDKDGTLLSFNAARPTNPQIEEKLMKYLN